MNDKLQTSERSVRHKTAALDINPDTKVATLLKNYPELENVLIELSPTFGKLQNPVLRRTVARITSLRQAAQIAGIKLGFLINELRKATGFDTVEVEEEAQAMTRKPDWFSKDRIISTFDARDVIESGGHPISKVLADVETLKRDDIYLLVTPFLPAPLIEMLSNKGFKSWSENIGENECLTYITAAPDRK